MMLLEAQIAAVTAAMPFGVVGQVQGIGGLTIEACDLALPVGSLCKITSLGGREALAEVIGFQHDCTLLMPLDSIAGVSRGDRIENLTTEPAINCSPLMLGRVLNGFGQPIDERGPLPSGQMRRLDARGALPLDRRHIDTPIATGVRAIDGLLTCGMGQRMGIFSGPGVGKSTLLSQIARSTSADVTVVALIGERGSEVREFLQHSLGEEGLKRCVIIVATNADAPLLRVRAAKVACTISEYFRDQGKNVLLLLDSLTRLCQAQRQIGLAAREPPATKGLPPSVFALLPEILERAGKTAIGSITGFYAVLVEGDDFNEPIPDAVKGISDGHLWLNRTLANRGHFPAIDMLQSISRARPAVTAPAQQAHARQVLKLISIYEQIEDMVNIGAYVPRANLEFDLAVQTRKKVVEFLQQDSMAQVTLEQTQKDLADLNISIEQTDRSLRTQTHAPRKIATDGD